MAIAVAVTAVDVDARRRHRRHRRRHEPKIIAEKPLFDRLGGRKVLEASIEDFFKRAAADARLLPAFAKAEGSSSKLSKARASVYQQLCELARGPCHYSGPKLADVKKAVAINDVQFVAAAEDFSDALESKGVSERERNELLAAIGTLRADVVTGKIAVIGTEESRAAALPRFEAPISDADDAADDAADEAGDDAEDDGNPEDGTPSHP